MRKRQRINLNERDNKILLFLWRWKFVSTKAISTKFFNDASDLTCYSRMNQLRQAGYILSESVDTDGGRAWTLTQKGFIKLNESLPELEKQIFKGENPKHDFIVSSLHIGSWLNHVPDGCDVFSEQQLRTFHPDIYPTWVPKCEYYRPDGYWLFNNNGTKTIVALEVELSRKADQRYDRISDFYSHFSHVQYCLWAVPSIATANRLLDLFNKIGQKNLLIHQFVLINDVLKKNWQSPIQCGHFQEKTIREFIHKFAPNCPQFPPNSTWDLDLINTRLSFNNSTPYATSQKTENRD